MTDRKIAAVVAPQDAVFEWQGVAGRVRGALAGVEVGYVEVHIEQGPVLRGPSGAPGPWTRLQRRRGRRRRFTDGRGTQGRW